MPKQTLKEKTAKGLFWGGVSNGVQQVLNLIFGLVLARLLDASDYGMVGMLAIFSAIAGTIQESGFTAALTNQKEIKHEDYNAVFWFNVLTGIVFYIILFFCTPLIADFYGKPELIGLSRVVFLGLLFGGIGIASNAYLFKVLMVKQRAKIDIISLLCSGIVGITLALNGFAYYGLAIQTTTYIGMGALQKFIYSPWKPSLHIDFAPLKMMFGFSLKLILSNFCTQISNNIFSVVLGKFYSPQQVGYYSQGQKWMGMGHSLIGGMISGVAQPVMVEVRDDKQRQIAVFRKMVRFGAFISLPTMFGLAFAGEEFVSILLGDKWSPSVPFLQLFCLWGAVGYMWNIYTNLLISHQRSDIYFYGIVFTSICQLIVVFALYPLGIYPMVIGYICVYYLSLLFWHYNVNKIVAIPLFYVVKDIIPYVGAVVLSVLIAYFVTMNIENIFLLFFSKVFVFAIVYLLVMRVGDSTIFRESINYIRK